MHIKLYTTTTCPYCKMEKEFLDSKGIKYDNVFVDQDHKAAEEMFELSHQLGVPFAVITKDDGTKKTLLGFDKEELSKILGV